MSRLDDVQAAHDAIDNLLAKEMTMTPTRHHAAEHAAIPGLLTIARAAHKVDEIYEGLRTDASDGEFSIWSEDDLMVALHALRPALADFEAGRDA
jgi:hypothetical protein